MHQVFEGAGFVVCNFDLPAPGGHAHGPQPSAIEASIRAEHFDELAVMVDTSIAFLRAVNVDRRQYAMTELRQPHTRPEPWPESSSSSCPGPA